MFNLFGCSTRFALDTIKIKEVVPYQRPTVLPAYHKYVVGAVTIRGTSMPIVDLSVVMGGQAVPAEERDSQTLIVADCMRMLVAFMVHEVERIMSYDWKFGTPLPETLGQETFILGTTRYEERLAQLLDIEQVLVDIFSAQIDEAGVRLSQEEIALLQQVSVIVVDDFSIARKPTSELLDRFGVSYQTFKSTDEALSVLRECSTPRSAFHVLVSDIEMPKMDGYELVFAVNDDPNTRALYTILYSSLSSDMSQERAKQFDERFATRSERKLWLIIKTRRPFKVMQDVDA
ncbi:chemotaxis protein [Vibrio sp. SCSIO 43169]|uniref:chemotaxis protein n=1 Tax=Vibrio sp. SCSIO 43169 TaxID=2822801 RepID=UPI002072A3CB|nr:chemotaxis protein [Vibrio sp. SCSIO 43169]MCM5511067.1 chemotaxis protein CheV [Vibrio sp. SCSIO 43169]